MPNRSQSATVATVRKLGKHYEGVESCAISADGAAIISGEGNKAFLVWECADRGATIQTARPYGPSHVLRS